MTDLENYECEGQMNIYDYIDVPEKVSDKYIQYYYGLFASIYDHRKIYYAIHCKSCEKNIKGICQYWKMEIDQEQIGCNFYARNVGRDLIEF